MALVAAPTTHCVLETSAGSFIVELYYAHAPRTCENFIGLANSGYYDGTVFHRIIKDFMIQGGDPTGTGRGGECIWGGKFGDEITRDLKHVGAGVLSMANAGPNTNGSQFFITLAPTPWLDGKHTIFGRVSAGMGIVQRLGSVPVDASDRPRDTVTLYKARPFNPAAAPAAAGDGGEDMAAVGQAALSIAHEADQ